MAAACDESNTLYSVSSRWKRISTKSYTLNKSSDPTTVSSCEMASLDESMLYLQHHPQLEHEVSRALVSVINERAPDPLARMLELFSANTGKGNVKGIVTLEAEVETLRVENAELQRQRKRLIDENAELQRENGRLKDVPTGARVSVPAPVVSAPAPVVSTPAPVPKEPRRASPADATARRRADLMARLFDALAKGKDKLWLSKVAALHSALKDGCESSEDPEEREAMFAFLDMLALVKEGRTDVTRAAWISTVPPPSCTLAQQEGFLTVLEAMLGNQDAIEGFAYFVDEQEAELNSAVGQAEQPPSPSATVDPIAAVMAEIFSKVCDLPPSPILSLCACI